MVDGGWSKVDLMREEEREAKDVGVVGICSGGRIRLAWVIWMQVGWIKLGRAGEMGRM